MTSRAYSWDTQPLMTTSGTLLHIMQCLMRHGIYNHDDHEQHSSSMTWEWNRIGKLPKIHLMIAPPPYPTLHIHLPTKLPPQAKLSPIPFCMSPEPNDTVYAASAAKMKSNLWDTVIEFIQKDGEGKNEVFQQVHISPSPYYDAFTERLDLRQWHPNDHPTAGLRLIQDDGRVMIAAMDPSTPASRIPRWQT